MGPSRDLHTERSDRGVVTVTFDVVDRSVNLFSAALLRELSAVVETLEHDPSVMLVVFRSAKPSGFIAGADLNWVRQLQDARDVQSMLGEGQRLCGRVASLPMPTIAVIHGHCLGGGLEFALACAHRLARDDSSTLLGLPETLLGLIPGWGGTQRLPQLVGRTIALRMIQEGRSVTAAESYRIGLTDTLLAPPTFDRDMAAFVDQCLCQRRPLPRQRPGWFAQRWAAVWLQPSVIQRLARWKRGPHATDNPAQLAARSAARRAIDVGCKHGLESGLTAERDEFVQLLFDPQCREQLDQFFQRQRRPRDAAG